jgi:hypothetical protein
VPIGAMVDDEGNRRVTSERRHRLRVLGRGRSELERRIGGLSRRLRRGLWEAERTKTAQPGRANQSSALSRLSTLSLGWFSKIRTQDEALSVRARWELPGTAGCQEGQRCGN